jgi:hemerythrin-like domain-containing protein
MNKATQNLEDDHVYILELTDIMVEMAGLPALDPRQVEEVVDIIRNFADGLHHAKEEKLLFPLMVEKGFSLQAGPIAVMLSDHEQGRQYVKEMADGVVELKNGNPHSPEKIREAMLGYVELLQSHIAKENNVLFRMADQVMNTEEEAELFGRFKALDGVLGIRPNKTDYITMIKALKNRI